MANKYRQVDAVSDISSYGYVRITPIWRTYSKCYHIEKIINDGFVGSSALRAVATPVNARGDYVGEVRVIWLRFGLDIIQTWDP